MIQLPELFIDRTKGLLKEEWEDFQSSMNEESPACIRINRNKANFGPNEGEMVPWSEDGFYLKQRPTYSFDPLFHAGCYYAQEASSMFLFQAIKQFVKTPVRYLDLCAAPGGKTTLATSSLPSGSLIVSNEPIRNRANILVENVIKWGSSYNVVTNNYPKDFAPLENYFDVIATDVPCSGEGMFRKDPVAIQEWSLENIHKCVFRGKEIIDHIWPTLKPGGLFIYSTCTYNKEENEQQIAYISEKYGAIPLVVETDDRWGIQSSMDKSNPIPVYRFLPHKLAGEGLFMAVLQKPHIDFDPFKLPLLKKKEKKNEKIFLPISPIKEWVQDPELFFWEETENEISLNPKEYAAEINFIDKHLNVIYKGLSLAIKQGKGYFPHHALAMNNNINKNAFPKVELGLEDALKYLRKEALVLDENIVNGAVLVCYKDVPLGFVKQIGTRANNLYPEQWRIRSGYTPEQICFGLK